MLYAHGHGTHPDWKLITGARRLRDRLPHILFATVPQVRVKGAIRGCVVGQIGIPLGKVVVPNPVQISHSLALVDPRRPRDGLGGLELRPVKVAVAICARARSQRQLRR